MSCWAGTPQALPASASTAGSTRACCECRQWSSARIVLRFTDDLQLMFMV
jgi:hypothetical protein